MSLVTRVHDLSGALVLDLNPATGYKRVDVSVGGVTWRRIVVTSPFVDGEFETQSVKGATRLNVTFRIDATTWAVVEQKTDDLLAAVEPHHLFVLGNGGRDNTYRARPADVDASYTKEDLRLNRRFVSLEIPVQPNPSVAGP